MSLCRKEKPDQHAHRNVSQSKSKGRRMLINGRAGTWQRSFMEVSDAELLHFVTENGIVNVREVLASYEMKNMKNY